MQVIGLGRAFLIYAALAATGCGAMGEDVFDGSYAGDATDSQSSSNVKQVTLQVSASGNVVSGAYTLKAVILNVSGTVAGTITGSTLDLTLTPGAGVNDCPYKITGTWQGDRILGAYAAFNCPVRSDGTLNLKK